MGQTEWSTLVESICAERGLSVVLSWDMPQGYETANGTFDPVAKNAFSQSGRTAKCAGVRGDVLSCPRAAARGAVPASRALRRDDPRKPSLRGAL